MWSEVIYELRRDCAVKQKKGLHFILASVVIWAAILIIHTTELTTEQKNLLTFCCSAPLMPLAYIMSKLLKVDFSNKSNPLTKLGILFSVNQMLYILIVMWVFSCVPEKMLMVYTMVFGAHLLPFGWLYMSRSYYMLSVFIPLLALCAGLNFRPVVMCTLMITIELGFSIALVREKI